MHKVTLLLVFLTATNSVAQEQTIQLSEPTYHDNISAGLVSFTNERKLSPVQKRHFKLTPLHLPTSIIDYKYFSIYSSIKDSFIDVLVKRTSIGDSLYIDLDNNNDLTDDGGPFFFPLSDNEFSFPVSFNANVDRISVQSFLRLPAYALTNKEVLQHFWSENFESNGNLNMERTIYWKRHNSKFTGEKGSFYYLGRKNLVRGKFIQNRDTVHFGVEDYNINGLFNDAVDRLYIDYNGNKKLSYKDNSERFSINDQVQFFGNSYSITKIDSLGKWVTFKRSTENSLNSPDRFLNSSTNKTLDELKQIYKSEYNTAIWEMSFLSIDGDSVHFIDYQDSGLLINFWGEWCQPCYKEMPLLSELNDSSLPIAIISFLLPSDLDKAKTVIEEKQLNWPHILVDDTISDWFNISGYPANFLLSPYDSNLIHTIGIDSSFVRRFIE